MARFAEALAQQWEVAKDATMDRAMEMKAELCSRFEAEKDELKAEIAVQADEIADMRAELTKMKMDKAGNKDTLDMIQDKLAVTFGAGASATKTKHLHTRIFLHWRAYAQGKAGETKLIHVACGIYGRKLKGRVMNAWASYFTGTSRDKERQGSQALMKKTAEEIVSRYDNRLHTLEAQLAAAQLEVVEGHRRRQHLEDELRRTLLKGINAMNLQALNIFQSAADVDSTKAHSFGVDCEPSPRLPQAYGAGQGDPVQAAASATFSPAGTGQQQMQQEQRASHQTSASSFNDTGGRYQPPIPRSGAPPRPTVMAASGGVAGSVKVERHVRRN